MDTYRTPLKQLANVLHNSREAWKKKTKDTKYENKKFSMRVSYLKEANQTLHEELRQAREKLERLNAAAAVSQKKIWPRPSR